MKKRLVLLIGIFLFASILFSGCDLFSTITVKVTNNNSWIVEVYYRDAGASDWTKATTVDTTDNEETFDLPAPGNYDFKVQDWVSGGDYVDQTLLDQDCSLDIDSEVDYYMTVSSTGTVSFY
jgi:hypothetical protein